MAGELLDRFEAEAERYDVGVVHTTPEAATDAIAQRTEGSTVGAPLSDPLSLPEAVTTDPTPAELEGATTGITEASIGVASYGSIGLRTDGAGSEPISLFTEHHVAVIRESDVVPDMPSAFDWLGDELRSGRDSVVLATGPSATADMGALVQGAHGPKTVDIVLVS